ncbi:MAG: SDR family oxidoreductase [Thermostichales cyanobacterium SZTDM-1c_bins_54]
MTDVSARAIVTGASRGIGKAIVAELVKHGIPVGLVARDGAALEAQVKEIIALGQEAHAYPMDLADSQSLPQQWQQLLADFGPCSILINNAGMGYTAPLAATPLADWERLMALNVTAPLLAMQAVLPGMRQQRRGTIINIVSIAGKQTFPHWGAYCASKFALLALTHTLAQEEQPHGIRVTALCPGAVATSLWDDVEGNFDRSKMLSPSTVAAMVMQAILLPPEAVLQELVLMPAAGTL